MAVLAAKGYFIVTGLAQQILLTRAIGLAEYGALSRALGITNILNAVVISSSTQGVSRTVVSAGERWKEGLRASLRVHVPLAIGLALLFALMASPFAQFQKAPEIRPVLLTLSGVVLLYGLYAPLVGALNGRGQFTKQATLDIMFATLRTLAFVGGGYLFAKRGLSGALGAAAGFVLAAALIVPLALRWTGIGQKPQDAAIAPPGAYLSMLVPVAVAQLFTNVLLQADLFLLGRFLSVSGEGETHGSVLANEWVGVYKACQLFAFLPYQLLFSVTQILFPMLARAKAEGDPAQVRAYALRGSRIAAIVAGLLVSLVVAEAGPLLALAFSADISVRGELPLRILAMGQGCFAILGVALTILTSLGRERTSAVLTALAAGLVALLCWGVVPQVSFGASQLLATACSTTIALLLVLAFAVTIVRKEAGAFVGAATAVRVLVAFLGAAAVGVLVPHSAIHGAKLLIPFIAVVSAAIAALYVGVLVLTGELGREDIAAVKAVVSRGKR